MNTEKYLASDGYYHYIYKITFTTTGQYYYGQHSVLLSHIENDKYMGSGKKLNECYQLSGYQDAVKEICCYAETFEELDILEQQYIGDKWKPDFLCLNMTPGGRSADKHQSRVLGGINAQQRNKEVGFNPYSSWWNSLSNQEKDNYKKLHLIPKNFKYDWTGRKHKPETIQKMKGPKLKITGKNNGNFGNKWCYHPELNFSICVPEILWWDLIATGYIAGRKILLVKEQHQNLSKKSRENMLGKKRITNGIVDKYIGPNDIMPDGFYFGSKSKGKPISIKVKTNRKTKNEYHKKEMYDKLKPMLKVFEEEGFEEVVQKFDYKYSRNNLVQQFKTYIPYPEYIPNKHTKNTKAKQYKKNSLL